jgi:hypothetical protein
MIARATTAAFTTLAALAALAPSTAFAQGEEPAGGAAIGEIVTATAGAAVVTTLLLVLGIGHRSGGIGLLQRASELTSRLSGLPGWAVLPAALTTLSLLIAVFGMYWDISLHIDVGRDEGPLANPAHYFILIGLFGIFAAGFIAMVLPREKPSTSAVRITRNWHAPLGGVLICACGAFSLIGFPLDDVWHRLFGQDVTLWGPTHLMLIGGASMALVGIAVLLVEGLRSPKAEQGVERRFSFLARRVALAGGLLIGLSTFQAEFDFGVPQFRFVFQPMMIMMAAGVGLVATRMWLGRGAALGAVGFFLAIRGIIALVVGPVLGETTPHMPLYIVEAGLVELVALRMAPNRRPLAFGAICGALIGTIGLAAEWGWSHVWMPIPWPSELLPEAAVLGFVTALAGALVGAWIGAHLAPTATPRRPSLRLAAALASAALALAVGYALYKPADSGVRADVRVSEVRPSPNRTVSADVTLDPPTAADDAEWLTVTAWQGDGLVVDRLERTGPGRYRTTEPIPVYGNWKAILRLHNGNSLTGVPVFLPEDKAIPAKEVPAPARFSREFVADHAILQREQKSVAPALTAIAYGVVVAIALALLVLLAWGLHRLALAAPGADTRPPRPAAPDRQPAVRKGAPATG